MKKTVSFSMETNNIMKKLVEAGAPVSVGGVEIGTLTGIKHEGDQLTIVADTIERRIVPPLSEGHIKKGGVNEAPTKPKPNIRPPAQRGKNE